MRWTIEGFSQKRLIEIGLDVVDAVILRFIADFYLSGKMSRLKLGEKEFFWLCYSHVLSELPILNIEKRQFSNRIDKIVATGAIEKEVVRAGTGTRAYFRFDEEIYSALVADDEFIKKEKQLIPEQEVQEKVERRVFKDLFFRYYQKKALEIRGSPTNPMWGAKEATLLKGDLNQLGEGELRKCMRAFFSDIVQEVKEFTRTKNKAGYSYTVFHGMLGKLSMSGLEPAGEPCEECGGWGSWHRPGCSMLRTMVEQREEFTKEEVEETKEALSQMDIAAMFNQAVGKTVLTRD